MGLLNFVPLVLALLLLAPVALSPVSRTAYRTVTRVALQAFGTYVQTSGRRRSKRSDLLRPAHVGETYRLYASKTWVYATLAAVTGSILGVYLVGLVLAVLTVSPETIRETLPSLLGFLSNVLSVPALTVGELFVLLLFSSATVGLLGGATTYWLRWETPSHRGSARAIRIDASLARTVAFVYALSRSGMAFPEIMRTLARNRDVYGEAAEEVAVGVKAMDLFGLDMLTAIRQMSRQSPSEKFEEFGENLASVLQSGQSLPSYLHEQYERYRQDAKAEQEAFLELLATLAEGYVSLFVVSPLLFITILVVIGLMGVADTLSFLHLMAYLLIPLGNVGFRRLPRQHHGIATYQPGRTRTDRKRLDRRSPGGRPGRGASRERRWSCDDERRATGNVRPVQKRQERPRRPLPNRAREAGCGALPDDTARSPVRTRSSRPRSRGGNRHARVCGRRGGAGRAVRLGDVRRRPGTQAPASRRWFRTCSTGSPASTRRG
ncbi:type II secretion system F family protein [Haladaptatus halobius]|uniref:type II secretion system F family protein n=1 Tax=Haladaptatus halobius TaxID=2884875 RepID=UPI001D0B7AF9|nr:type II secretion system F family protein [Haladaptatus halobius]